MIREATDADVPRIVEMIGHFIVSTPYAAIHTVQPDALEALVGTTREFGVLFVAEVDGQLEGFIAGYAITELVSRLFCLDELAWWVEPAFRKGSIGPKLLHAFEDWGRQAGVSVIKMVAPAHTDVARYYVRRGYAEVETAYMKRLK